MSGSPASESVIARRNAHESVPRAWDIPQNWTWTVVGDVGEVGLGRQRSPINHSGPHMRPYVRAANVTWTGWDLSDVSEMNFDASDFAKFQLQYGDVVLNEGSGSAKEVGKSVIWRNEIADCCFQNTLLRVQPKACTSEFLHAYFTLAARSGRFVSETQGVNIFHIGKDGLFRFAVPLPPLPEQRRIVAKLNTLDARAKRARADLDRIPALVARAKQAILAKAFNHARMPTKTISEITCRVTKGASPKWQGFEYQSEGTRFIRSQNVGWGILTLDDPVFVGEAFNAKQKNSVIKDLDILLNIVGASIGRSAIASKVCAGANCNQAVAVIRLKEPNIADAKYLSTWLRSPSAQDTISNGSVDVARANFSLGSIGNLSLPWPTSAEREDIVRRIESAFAKIDRIAADAASASKLLTRLDQAILTKAFRGELVPQDPNDEPAEVLLARIRGSSTAQPTRRRRARNEIVSAT